MNACMGKATGKCGGGGSPEDSIYIRREKMKATNKKGRREPTGTMKIKMTDDNAEKKDEDDDFSLVDLGDAFESNKAKNKSGDELGSQGTQSDEEAVDMNTLAQQRSQ